MTWKIKLYGSSRGEKPVEEFIKSLEPQTTAKVTHHIDLPCLLTRISIYYMPLKSKNKRHPKGRWALRLNGSTRFKT